MHPDDSASFGIPLSRQKSVSNGAGGRPLGVLENTGSRSSRAKVKRHGSKLLSAIRSWARSRCKCPLLLLRAMISRYATFANKSIASFSSETGPPPAKFIKLDLPTVVVRTRLNSRPSVVDIDLDNDIFDDAQQAEASTSVESGSDPSSGKSSNPFGDSTGKTSLESKFPSQSKLASLPDTIDHKKAPKSPKDLHEEKLTNENTPLTPIAEVEGLESPVPLPTIVTVEKAAAAKMFFETHYNGLTSEQVTRRSLRRRQLELALQHNTTLSLDDQDAMRQAWAEQESDHLRATRVMKVRGVNASKGKDFVSSKYETVKILGKGSFGVVRLVRERAEPGSEATKEIYAMKVIRKSDMLRNSQEGHLRAERDFLVAAEGSRWVVPLISSFQDLNNLYLVMDYMPGGDFLGLLIRDNVLTESISKFYIAEMILCIEEAHSLRWIHRDIKPDNFLISASGHLKISDFGLAFDGHWSHDQGYFNNHRHSLLAKLGIQVDGDSLDKKEGRSISAALKAANILTGLKDRHERREDANFSEPGGILNWRNRNSNRSLARSVVGTSQYMAPEVVRGELYDARCDWWSLAVILYECLYGHTPFLAEEGGRQQTKVNIVKHKSTFAFPNKPPVSRRCQDLIRSIIQEKDDRLCSKRYKLKDKFSPGSRNHDHAGRYVFPDDAEDIKSHKWFKDIQWDKLHLMVPPFVPDISSTEDTHYFDEEEPISDFSDSACLPPPTVDDITDALKPFNRDIQLLATGFIDKPADSVKMRKIEKEIDTFNVCEEQKDYLKCFVRHYGKKEKKRPRDRCLRDRELAPRVLEIRKKGAFLGYTYRRIRYTKSGSNTVRRTEYGSVTSPGKKKVWHRARLSIH